MKKTHSPEQIIGLSRQVERESKERRYHLLRRCWQGVSVRTYKELDIPGYEAASDTEVEA